MAVCADDFEIRESRPARSGGACKRRSVMNLKDACGESLGIAALFRQSTYLAMQGTMNTAEVIEFLLHEKA